jgi:hypothetical protein
MDTCCHKALSLDNGLVHTTPSSSPRQIAIFTLSAAGRDCTMVRGGNLAAASAL